jgi:hypothetical protein
MKNPTKTHHSLMWAYNKPNGDLGICNSKVCRVRYPRKQWQRVRTFPVLVLVMEL